MSSLFVDTPYLVFQNHETQNDAPLDARPEEIEVLRRLACRYAEIAADPVNGERRRAWSRLNDLRPERPLVWMNEVCWNEMNVGDELTLRTENVVCRRIETELRRTIYQWTHMQGDMVVDGEFCSPFILRNAGFGVQVEADVLETEEGREIASRRFHNQFTCDDDLEKIRNPIVTVDDRRTEEFHQLYGRIFEGILPVRRRGCTGFWYAPWDEIVFWMGAENVLESLLVRPEFMHRLIARVCEAFQRALDQYQALGLVARNDTNVRIGSGAYGYSADLPGPQGAGGACTAELWGSSTAQIFGSVSPEQHEEFGIEYERRWLGRFGLSYYGCCEPLHNKIEKLSTIPNLRKISVSPWADVAAAAEQMRGRYVISLKPSPSCLAQSVFDAETVREELRNKLAAARGCNVEIVMKDISTVRHEPQRLWRWAEVAREVVEEVG